MLIEMFIEPGKTAAGEIVFNAAQLAAAAAGEREITSHHLQRIHRQPDMAKFTGNIAMSGNRFTVEDQAAAHSGTENQPHDQRILRKFIVPGFGESKAVGIVIQTDFTPEPGAQIAAQRLAAGSGDVGGIQRAVRGFRHPRNTNPYRPLTVKAAVSFTDQRLYRLQKVGITLLRRGNAFFPLQSPRAIKHAQRYFAATNVKSVVHSNSSLLTEKVRT